MFYDIAASPAGLAVGSLWVYRVAQQLNIPFCVAGGIRCLADAAEVLNSGADKVSINSPALDNPVLIDVLARRFGSQCIVIGIDSRRTPGGHQAWQFSGDPRRARTSGRTVSDWVREVQDRGAGEIVLNCMDSDGVRNGYDIQHLHQIRSLCRIPLIASGGAGTAAHFRDVFLHADVDGALAASVFHSGEISIPQLKSYLSSCGIPVRPSVPEAA